MSHKTNLLTLNINVVSAKDLTEIDQITASKTKLYVAVSLTGAAQTEQKAQTHVDKDGGRNPTWNFPVKFVVDVDGVKQDLETRVVFVLKHDDGKVLGEVHVSIVELMQVTADDNYMKYVVVSYPIKKAPERTVGKLNFEFEFGVSPTSVTPTAASATRNVPPPAAGNGGYPPSPYPYGPYPPQYPPYHGGYYAAPPYGYSPHASHVQAHRSSVGTNQRSIANHNNKSGKWTVKVLGAFGTLAVRAITGGSVPDLSGFQMSD